MVGPIIGPTLGGWLTETLNWRWVFFINLPVGIIAFLGCSAYLPAAAKRLRRFDFFGFAMLALGIGARQLMLGRGRRGGRVLLDRNLGGTCLGGRGLLGVVIHILNSDDPFLDPRIFADRNFVSSLLFIFIIGIILLASLALLPPMLAQIFGYPTITLGLVMAPRGVGTMISMILVGRLMRFVDTRLLVTTGLLLAAYSLHLMTAFSPQMDDRLVILSGVVQGLGLGLIFVPLSSIAFSTMAPAFRADGTSLFSPVRNIGSSIGISIVSVFLARNVQVNHAGLGDAIIWFSPTLRPLMPEATEGNPAALSQVDGLVNLQS